MSVDILGQYFYTVTPKDHKRAKSHFLMKDTLAHNDRQLKILNAYFHQNKPINPEYRTDDTIMADWKFFNRKLNATEKKEFIKWYDKNHGDLEIYVAETLSAGYKLSVSADPLNETCTASLTPTKYSRDTTKGSLTSKHKEYIHAMALVIFKHVVICGEEGWSKMDMGKDDDWG